jgi:phosphate:Na+ symporter
LFVDLIKTISGNSSLQQQIANAHMFFNTMGVILFLPFIGLAERALNKLLPDKPEKEVAPAAG